MIARPDIDSELRGSLAEPARTPAPSLELLAQMREMMRTPADAVPALDRRDVEAPGPDGASIPLSILRPTGAVRAAPCVFWIHGGGMIMGDRFSQIELPLEWLDRFGAVVVTVEYRVAPEGTTLVEDCYHGLLWVAGHADEIGIDPSRIVVAGVSGGGGLTAGVTLMARDRGAPAIAAQILICPMLDHRNATTSSHQFSGGDGVWPREMNAFAWRSVLGDREAHSYVSPALADDLSGLPTTYIDAGSAEVFRDEAVAYATRIWAAGGQAELHVWAGGFHGFDVLVPKARVSAAARAARIDWLARVL
jgi:acetyl esterase/lipase